MASTSTREEEITRIVDGIWIAILDERAQSHQSAQSFYRLCTVFLNYFAKEEGCSCPAMDGPELRFFTDHVLRTLRRLSLNSQERAHILSTLFEKVCASIARPHKLGT